MIVVRLLYALFFFTSTQNNKKKKTTTKHAQTYTHLRKETVNTKCNETLREYNLFIVNTSFLFLLSNGGIKARAAHLRRLPTPADRAAGRGAARQWTCPLSHAARRTGVAAPGPGACLAAASAGKC